MKPIDAKTDDQICKLQNDNIETAAGIGLLVAESEVSIFPAESGGFHLNIPRKDWDEMVAWYTTGKVPAGDTR